MRGRVKLWENCKMLVVLGVIAIIVVGIIYGTEHRQGAGRYVTRPRHKRSIAGDLCLQTYGGIELNYTKNSTTSFTFDLCSVINCGGRNRSWRGYVLVAR